MSKTTDSNPPVTADPSPTGRRYHKAAFLISCFVACYSAGQFIWLIPSADQLATVTLASYYALMRMIQLITIRKPFQLTLNLNGPLVIFDQIYLAAMSLYGLPVYLSMPLSGALLFMTSSLGPRHLYIAMPAAFFSILFTLTGANDLQLESATAITLSLAVIAVASLNIILPRVVAAIRMSIPSTNGKSQESQTRDSKQKKQQYSPLLKPVGEKTGLRILIISNNDKRLATISDHLNDWDYDYTTSRNCVQAFRHMLSRCQANKFVTYTTLIVDQQGLDLDPISLAQLIHDEPKLQDIRLVCFKTPASLHQQSQKLYQAGYAALLESPLNKAQLFSALHDERQHYPDSTNIVSLLEHRANKKSKADKGVVLLADSASSARTALGKALNKTGYKVIMVDDGDQALDALEEHPIRVAIINIKLTIMSGIQVLKLHRFTTPYKQWIPFVFLCDENNADTLRLCRSIGVQACFFKPVVANDLLDMIPTLLTQYQSREAGLNQDRNSPDENNVTQLQNASLLDHMTLLRLERLDNGIAFINDLFKIFEAEGAVILRNMRQAVDKNQCSLFIEQAQILLDSAGQLGAIALYELNRNATRLLAYEFEYRGKEILEEIEETFSLTLGAFSHYLSQRASSLHEDSL